MAEKTMEKMKSIRCGNVNGLHFKLDWLDTYGTPGPVGSTWGELQLWIQETLVWGQLMPNGQPQGIQWSWIELLEFLANAWPYLLEEESYPIKFDARDEKPRHIGELRGMVKLRAFNLPQEVAVQEDEALRDFLLVHDLSEALQGGYPSKILFLRRGYQMLVATLRQEFILSFHETIATLENLGDNIFQRLQANDDKRSNIACQRWTNKNAIPSLRRLEIATHLDAESISKVWPIDINAENNSVYELKAAARMIGKRVTEQQLADVLKQISSIPKKQRQGLGEIWEKAKEILERHSADTPAVQGYLMAWMLREHLNNPAERVEPEALLKTWKVSVKRISISNCLLDAIAVWSNEHNPTIFINRVGPRSQHPTGVRSTLAHEMCHILIDLDGALPVVDVLGGDMPRAVEKRANAFAAEFLLPRAQAHSFIENSLRFVHQQSERRLALERAINELVEKYGVSHEMATWQVIGSTFVNATDQKILRKNLKSVSDPYSSDLD